MAALDNTYGALLIGVLTAGILYGVTCAQTWYYFIHYPNDSWHLKLLVISTLLLDTGHQAVITSTIYTYLITNYGSSDLGVLVWSVIGEVFFTALTTLLVQCFLTMRIWKLSNKNWFMTVSAMVLVVAGLLVSFIFSAKTIRFARWEQLKTLKPLSLTINALGATGDAIIAGYLCYLLQKSRTGFQRSETMINKLIMFTINTGLLTSLCAVASFITYNAWPKTYIYVTFYFNIGRLYCNSLLATLNARKLLRGEGHDDMSLSFQGNNTRFGTSATTRGVSNISIKIDTTREYMQDEFPSTDDSKDPVVV